MDTNYRTIPKRESRGIAGHSMGGGGSTNISLKHPDKYSVVYLMSPAIGAGEKAIIDSMFPNDSTMMILDDLSQKMAKVDAKDFQKEITKVLDNSNYNLSWILAYGMAFAPDTSQPLKMKLPFNKKANGEYEINKENYALWKNGLGGLEKKVAKYKSNLLQYKHYAIDCGYNDHLQFIIEGTTYYTSLLAKNNIPFSMQWHNGNHSSNFGEQLAKSVFPIMSVYLERE